MDVLLEKELTTTLPQGYTLRLARMADLEPAVDLINRHSRAAIDTDITTLEDIRNEWVSPGFTPERDICLVHAPDGTLAGYEEVWTTARPPVHPWVWGCVDPEHEDLGVGTTLLTWAESRARQVLDIVPAELRVAMNIGTYSTADKARRLFEDQGWRYFRSSYRMLIEMDAPPAAPEWPDGISARLFDPQRDLEAVYRAVNEAFRDHFGFIEPTFEDGFKRFTHFMTNENYDPTLWFLAMDGDEIAGMCLNRPQTVDMEGCGYVNTLGVRREWRKRGIGLALLLHTFGEFYQRGFRKVALGVDAQNLTGALRLYQKAGMHVYRQFDLFEKELRPGAEISVQSLQD